MHQYQAKIKKPARSGVHSWLMSQVDRTRHSCVIAQDNLISTSRAPELHSVDHKPSLLLPTELLCIGQGFKFLEDSIRNSGVRTVTILNMNSSRFLPLFDRYDKSCHQPSAKLRATEMRVSFSILTWNHPV